VGTSLGTDMAMWTAGHNLIANGHRQLDISGVKLLSPAVGARNVNSEDTFRDSDLSEADLIKEATRKFLRHMLTDPLRMAIEYPEEIGECSAILAAYALEPHKLGQRAAAIAGNFFSAQQGIDWSMVRDVAQSSAVHVLGGEDDPLIMYSLDQWQALRRVAPRTQIRLVQGMGHSLTMAANLCAENLADMEAAA
jgi:pimeloyl-ACP methyl ester carboxylesterase